MMGIDRSAEELDDSNFAQFASWTSMPWGHLAHPRTDTVPVLVLWLNTIRDVYGFVQLLVIPGCICAIIQASPF